jgi:hypothetical protein
MNPIVPLDSVAENTLIGMLTRPSRRNPFQVSRVAIVCPLVDRPIELYSGHAIRREGSAYDQRMGVAVLL